MFQHVSTCFNMFQPSKVQDFAAIHSINPRRNDRPHPTQLARPGSRSGSTTDALHEVHQFRFRRLQLARIRQRWRLRTWGCLKPQRWDFWLTIQYRSICEYSIYDVYVFFLWDIHEDITLNQLDVVLGVCLKLATKSCYTLKLNGNWKKANGTIVFRQTMFKQIRAFLGCVSFWGGWVGAYM